MKRLVFFGACLGALTAFGASRAAVITVTTTNNASVAGGEVSLLQALTQARDGDTIRFNIPGAGPHYIATPQNGYPLITANNLLIDGYSQPGSSANTNSILAPNNANIRVVLDSREGGRLVLANIPGIPLDGGSVPGYGESESAILALYNSTNVTVRGLAFLSKLTAEAPGDAAIYGVALIRSADDVHINGCWFGLDPNGTSVSGGKAGITGFRHRVAGLADEFPDRTTVGVKAGSTNAPAEFNVFVGMQISTILEGEGYRIAGNFFNVFPNGLRDFNGAFHPDYGEAHRVEGALQIGRVGSNTIIGTDGDGINDANERNIFAGVVPRTNFPIPGGYSHTIEFYGGPRDNIVFAGNYVGVGIDGQTRFTNGVPVIGGIQGAARVGSDFDGKSDALEGNLIYNNYPSSLFTPDVIVRDFLDGTGQDAIISLRGNTLVNNFAPPISPVRQDGAFITNYYAKALVDASAGITPVLGTNSTTTLLRGTAPVAETNFYPATIIDVYLPDPQGLTNSVPEAPFAFVQGLTYLGSFVEGSSLDRNATPGEFEFDISRLNLPEGTSVTVTANYSQSAAGTASARVLTSPFSRPVSLGKGGPISVPPLSIARSGNNVTINWTGGGFRLQSASSVLGPWTHETTTGATFTAPIAGPAKFYRLTSQ